MSIDWKRVCWTSARLSPDGKPRHVPLWEMPRTDTEVICQWKTQLAGEPLVQCTDPARWRVTMHAAACCGNRIVLACTEHEKVMHHWHALGLLVCLEHSSPLAWVSSTAL